MERVTVLPCVVVPGAEQIWTVVVGGGSGQRFGTPKQYASLGSERVIDHSRAAAASASDGVVVVVPAADAEREGAVAGGATRSASVRAGLAAVPDTATIICVHDAARPLADAAIFRRVIDAVVAGADAAIPAVPVTDTIKVVRDGAVESTPDRSQLNRARRDAWSHTHQRGGGSVSRGTGGPGTITAPGGSCSAGMGWRGAGNTDAAPAAPGGW